MTFQYEPVYCPTLFEEIQFRTCLFGKLKSTNEKVICGDIVKPVKRMFSCTLLFSLHLKGVYLKRISGETLPGLLAWVQRGWWVLEQAGCTSLAEEPSLVPHPFDPSGEGPGDKPQRHNETSIL